MAALSAIHEVTGKSRVIFFRLFKGHSMWINSIKIPYEILPVAVVSLVLSPVIVILQNRFRYKNLANKFARKISK
jgi:hypothetical protein